MKKDVSGMIFHPASLGDVDKAMGMLCPWAVPLYNKLSLYNKKSLLARIPSFKFFHINKITSLENKEIGFVGVLLPLLPEQLLSKNPALMRKRIRKAVVKAQRNGAKLVTLGSYTSIMTNQGLDICDDVPGSVTSGNTYTAALCINSVFKICKQLDLETCNLTLSIVGATGDIGSICAKIFPKFFKKTIFCSRKITKTSSIFLEATRSCGFDVEICQDPKAAVRNSDVVICATSAFTALFSSEDVKTGTIVCDISMPSNIARDLLARRPEVIAFEGGRAKIFGFEDIKNGMWSLLFPANSIYGCLAEALILAFEGRFENFSIGQGCITEGRVDEIYKLGLKHGFFVADFSSFGYFFTKEDFDNFKQIKGR